MCDLLTDPYLDELRKASRRDWSDLLWTALFIDVLALTVYGLAVLAMRIM